MEIKNYFAQDAQGNIMPSANCYLYLPGTTTLATGLVDGNGVPISNPFLASVMGQITFGAPNGVYDLRVALGARDWTIKVQCADIVQAMDVMDSILGSHAENPTTRNNGQPLEPGDETWNSTDKQPYWWNGADWVALNSSAQQLEERLARPVGSDMSGFIQQGEGFFPRTSLSKMRDTVSVKDAGAVAGGVIDCTAAFISAGNGSYVPAGIFLVDTLQVDLTQYHGPGIIYTTGGHTVRLDNEPQSTHYMQRKVIELGMGFDGSPALPDTQIYPGAQNSPQGLALDRDPSTGQRYFYVSQGVSGASWSAAEHVRITKWAYREDGMPQVVDTIGAPVRSSHSHLSTLREGGKLWMYQSATTPLDAINATSEAGKGWSKMEWKGADNVDADIVSYNVWGRPGSGHRYQNYGKGCVQVSQDGRYMILIGINYSGGAGGRTLFVYDRLQVESMADPLKAEPVFTSHALRAMDNDADTAYQGETTDGRYIYVCWGSASAYSRKGVTVYALTGEKIRDIIFEGPASLYTDDEIRNGHPAYGTCISFEPEGIAIQGGAIHVNFVDYWRANSAVVSHFGLNYVNTNSANLNNPPSSSPLYWRVTDRPATQGVWDAGITYNYLGSANTRRTKIIYAVEPKSEDTRQLPCVSRYMYPFSIAVNPSSASEIVDVSVPLGSTYNACQHNVNDDTYRMMFRYALNYTFEVRDCREGADADVRSYMRTTAVAGGDKNTQIGVGGTADTGGSVQFWHAGSSVKAGQIRIQTATGVAAPEVRTLVNGGTRLNITDTENILYQATRFVANNLYAWGTPSRVATTIYLHTAPVVSSDARLKSPVREMSDAEIAVGRRLAREPGFYKWLSSIEDKEKKGIDARWHSGMTVQRAMEIFEEEGLDPRNYGGVCHDEWGDEFETVDAVWLGTGHYRVEVDTEGNETREEIMEEWAPSSERQTQWAGDKFSFRENEIMWLIVKAMAFDQDQLNERLLALEKQNL